MHVKGRTFVWNSPNIGIYNKNISRVRKENSRSSQSGGQQVEEGSFKTQFLRFLETIAVKPPRIN